MADEPRYTKYEFRVDLVANSSHRQTLYLHLIPILLYPLFVTSVYCTVLPPIEDTYYLLYLLYLLPITYYLLPTTYYLLPTTYYLLPTTYYLLPTTYYLLPTTYYLLPITYYLLLLYLLPTTYYEYLLPITYYLLPTTYYLLPTTYCRTVEQYQYRTEPSSVLPGHAFRAAAATLPVPCSR